MTPRPSVLLFLLGLAGPALGAERPCDGETVDRGRREFKAAYDAGRIKEAVESLSSVRESCKGYLGQAGQESRSRWLWTVSDLSLAAYKLGDLKRCRELIEPLEDEFFQARDDPGFKAVWKSLAFNYHQCDCYNVKRPLCRERSWLRNGYGEIEGQVHDTLPAWRFRLVFDVSDTPQTRADGSEYWTSDATMSALEIRDLRGKVLQRIAIDSERGYTSYIGGGKGGPPLVLGDRNFDGYQDLAAGNECGTGACCTQHVYLFEPASKRFAFHEGASNVCFSDVDPAKKEIRSSWRASACEHGRSTYKWEKGELVEVERETENLCCDSEDCGVEFVLEKRVGGELKIVSTRKEKASPPKP